MHQKLLDMFFPQLDLQKELIFSELCYRRLFEESQEGILIVDAITGIILDANPFLKKILGYSRSELLGKQLWQVVIFKDIVGSREAFLALQSKGYVRYKDLPLQTKNGRNIDVEFISNGYLVGSQKVIQCTIRDVTSKRKVEEAILSRAKSLEQRSKTQEETRKAMLNVMEDLESARALLELEKAKDDAMLASIGEGLVAVNNEGKVMIMNQVAEEILGWSIKELRGKKITDLPLEDEAGDLIPLNKRPTSIALLTGEINKATYYVVKRDKTRSPLAITSTPIKLKGKIIGLVEIIRDITRESQINKAKSEFVSLASHQLRTPLGIAKWYIGAIQDEQYIDKAPEIAKDYLNEIYKCNERLLVLVRELLSISRIDQGKVRDMPKITDMIQLVKDVVKAMHIIAEKNKVTINLDLKQQKLPTMVIDPLRMQEMLENILTNAIEYSNALGKVDVTVDKQDDALVIIIKDTGIGISAEDKKSLYTKFYRSEKAIGHNPEGSGLGLYVVKSYVEGWGGKISVESAEDKGSTFTISLPFSQK